jgi:hypothetical protein
MTDDPNPVNSIVNASAVLHHVDMMIKTRFLWLALALGACAPLSIYYRPGVSVAQLDTDTTRCQVQALNDAPVANQIRQRPPIYYPGSQYCDAKGCITRPGYWVDGGFYTVDVNEPLRRRVLDMCMAQKGYQPVTVPRCSSAVEQAAPRTPTRTLPRLDESSCAIRYDDGTWQIVTPTRAIQSE